MGATFTYSCQQEANVNRKHQHSVILMVIVDDQCIFMDICNGFPGAVHDSRVFKNSPLGLQLMSPHMCFVACGRCQSAMKHWAVEEERTLLCIVQEKNLLAAIDGRRNKNAQVSMSVKRYLVCADKRYLVATSSLCRLWGGGNPARARRLGEDG